MNKEGFNVEEEIMKNKIIKEYENIQKVIRAVSEKISGFKMDLKEHESATSAKLDLLDYFNNKKKKGL